MKKFDYTIKDKLGIHARPAGLLTRKANEFKSKINIEKEGKTVDTTKLFEVISLSVKYDDKISIIVEGEDEKIAAQEMQQFLQNNI